MTPRSLLHLLQLTSPALPVGAYSYSEGLETLVQANQILDRPSLQHWLEQELDHGAIRVEAAVVARIYTASQVFDSKTIGYWNDWLSAFRETEELRQQSWQMGRSLVRLVAHLQPQSQDLLSGDEYNYATVFAVAAAAWEIDREAALLGYLQSWVGNLINAGVRLIPLGQTEGQTLLLHLTQPIDQTTQAILTQCDLEDDLTACSWGLSLASMNHETLYSRLFRS